MSFFEISNRPRQSVLPSQPLGVLGPTLATFDPDVGVLRPRRWRPSTSTLASFDLDAGVLRPRRWHPSTRGRKTTKARTGVRKLVTLTLLAKCGGTRGSSLGPQGQTARREGAQFCYTRPNYLRQFSERHFEARQTNGVADLPSDCVDRHQTDAQAHENGRPGGADDDPRGKRHTALNLLLNDLCSL